MLNADIAKEAVERIMQLKAKIHPIRVTLQDQGSPQPEGFFGDLSVLAHALQRCEDTWPRPKRRR